MTVKKLIEELSKLNPNLSVEAIIPSAGGTSREWITITDAVENFYADDLGYIMKHCLLKWTRQ